MSEIALVDHKEIVNRAFESSQHQPEYYDQNYTLRRHGSMANGMQLHSVMHPKLCSPQITCIPPYTSMADHDELPSFYKSKQFFADGLLLLVMLYFITIFSY